MDWGLGCSGLASPNPNELGFLPDGDSDKSITLPRTFADLPLAEKLQAKDAAPRCGLWVIDLRTGDIVHWLRLDGTVEELYDVAVLPGKRRPMAIGFKTDEIRHTLVVGKSPGV